VRTESFSTALLTTLVIASFTVFLLVAAAAKPLGASPAEVVGNFPPIADAEVTEGNPDSPDSSGYIYNLYVGWNSDFLSERAYFRFDLSEIPAGSTINSAVLWAMSKYGPSKEPSYTATWHLVDVHSVSDDTWDESTLTWATAPPIGPDNLDTENFKADDFLVSELPPDGQYKWYSWDVTSFVASEFEGGDPLVSMCLKGQNENVSDSAGWFYSKDGDNPIDKQPYLEVSYTTGAPADGEPTEIPWVYIGVAVAIIAIVAIVAVILKIRKPSRVAPKRARKRKK